MYYVQLRYMPVLYCLLVKCCGDTTTAYASAFRKLHKTFLRMRTSEKVQAKLKADPFSLVPSCKWFSGIPEVGVTQFTLSGHEGNHSVIQVGRYLHRSPVQFHAEGMGSTLKSDKVFEGFSTWAFKILKDGDCTNLLSRQLAPLLNYLSYNPLLMQHNIRFANNLNCWPVLLLNKELTNLCAAFLLSIINSSVVSWMRRSILQLQQYTGNYACVIILLDMSF